MSIKVSVRRRAGWGVIFQALVGGLFGFIGALTDNLELLIIGVWLMLQSQIHQMWDEQRERLS